MVSVLVIPGVLSLLKFNKNYMTKKEFIEKIKDILLIEGEAGMDYYVKIDSLASLLLIEFYDENFEFKLTSETLKQIKTISDLVELVKEQLY